MADTPLTFTPTSTHWGNYRIAHRDGQIVAVEPYAVDCNPTLTDQSLQDSFDDNVRIAQPMVRIGYLSARADGDRDTPCDLATEALQQVRSEPGNQTTFGGSYGWASAGRFSCTQSGTPHSRLAQGCSAHSCLVDVERFDAALPALKCHTQPRIIEDWSQAWQLPPML